MSGQAFVTLASQELAGQALAAVHGYVLHGLPIFVVRLSPFLSLSSVTPAALPHHDVSCRDVPCAAYGLLCGRRRVLCGVWHTQEYGREGNAKPAAVAADTSATAQ
jgi:hypothetical protein